MIRNKKTNKVEKYCVFSPKNEAIIEKILVSKIMNKYIAIELLGGTK
jgi:hypothetical protein